MLRGAYLSVALREGLLGRLVDERAAVVVGRLVGRDDDLEREAEVDDLDGGEVVRVFDDHVAWLEVAVDEVVAVDLGEPVQQLRAELAALLLGDALSLLFAPPNEVCERAPGGELYRQKDVVLKFTQLQWLFGVAYVFEFDDVGVVELLHDFGLVAGHFNSIFIDGFFNNLAR